MTYNFEAWLRTYSCSDYHCRCTFYVFGRNGERTSVFFIKLCDALCNFTDCISSTMVHLTATYQLTIIITRFCILQSCLYFSQNVNAFISYLQNDQQNSLSIPMSVFNMPAESNWSSIQWQACLAEYADHGSLCGGSDDEYMYCKLPIAVVVAACKLLWRLLNYAACTASAFNIWKARSGKPLFFNFICI